MVGGIKENFDKIEVLKKQVENLMDLNAILNIDDPLTEKL